MAIPPPDAARLAALNQHYAFGLSEAELAEFGPAVTATLAVRGRAVVSVDGRPDVSLARARS
ncbi:hypothetical protein FVA95_09770 [Pseudonocardia sp. EV170527-09]|uniref:hypothetical protein n=1 Tax=Pseudonocardia sp. EV170527-09 TaxID=2603411 RepID=UPI0011F10AD6|nr:hypothetical protein [Pseudonocardia sp. EV170527-09]KAA1030389.1 hypothetical protein FVA95_09770 [Pseudonocardia sp. EV170527-09]